MARTWERARSRVRLGHVIRYIGRGRAAVKAPRKPDAIHGPRHRSNCGQAPDNPRRTATLRQSEHVPLQAAGYLVTIAGCSGRWNPRTDARMHEQVCGDDHPCITRSVIVRANYNVTGCRVARPRGACSEPIGPGWITVDDVTCRL